MKTVYVVNSYGTDGYEDELYSSIVVFDSKEKADDEVERQVKEMNYIFEERCGKDGYVFDLLCDGCFVFYETDCGDGNRHYIEIDEYTIQ